jgi:hypothetical protein
MRAGSTSEACGLWNHTCRIAMDFSVGCLRSGRGFALLVGFFPFSVASLGPLGIAIGMEPAASACANHPSQKTIDRAVTGPMADRLLVGRLNSSTCSEKQAFKPARCAAGLPAFPENAALRLPPEQTGGVTIVASSAAPPLLLTCPCPGGGVDPRIG